MTKDQLNKLVDALYAAYKTEEGKKFFDSEAAASTTLTIGVGNVSNIGDATA